MFKYVVLQDSLCRYLGFFVIFLILALNCIALLIKAPPIGAQNTLHTEALSIAIEQISISILHSDVPFQSIKD